MRFSCAVLLPESGWQDQWHARILLCQDAGLLTLPVPTCTHARDADLRRPAPAVRPLCQAAAQDGLPAWKAEGGYRYVIADVWFLTVTRRSLRLAAQTASLTFTALQAPLPLPPFRPR